MNAAVEQALHARTVGELARAALLRCGGVLRPLPAFPDSPYRLAGNEIVWLGGEGGCWHPRRILLAKPGQTDFSGEMHVSIAGAGVWRPAALPEIAPAQGSEACAMLGSSIADIGKPAGFGALLAGDSPRFPLDLALARVRALADALQNNDAAAFASAALPLLGLGPGLTPSGDDLVGACLFARRLRGLDAGWRDTAQKLTRASAARTNAISAALFADLARGVAYAPLHELAAAMSGDAGGVLAAARRLTAIGHTSGWDMLTGFMLGAGGGTGWKPKPGKGFQPVADSIPIFSGGLPHLART